MSNSELLLTRGEQLRKLAKILAYIFIGAIALYLISGLIHSVSYSWSFAKSWKRFASIRPHRNFRIAKVIVPMCYLGAGIGTLALPIYFKALDFLGLGQIARNTEK